MATDAYTRLRQEILSGAFNEAAELDLSGRGLRSLPPEITTLTHVTKINAAGNQLSEDGFPADFDKLVNLRTLFFLGNAFTSVPPVLGRLPALFMLSFKSCRLTHIDGSALAPSLGWLILTDNQLTGLPAELGRLQHVRKLMLATNKLTALPDMSGCVTLELLRLSDNRLTAVPPSLLTLPKLAWLALGGNLIPPHSRDTPLDIPAHLAIPGAELRVGAKLGEGASGTVFAATWTGASAAAVQPGRQPAGDAAALEPAAAAHSDRVWSSGAASAGRSSAGDVAVKVFKDASSDGRPVDEVAAALALADRIHTRPQCVALGGAQNLIETLGVLLRHSEGDPQVAGGAGASAVASALAPTLVMELLPPSTSSSSSSSSGDDDPAPGCMALLGHTPSMGSVTRDVYPPGRTFIPSQALAVVTGVCRAVAAMHAAGLAHGDVYAHNTLVGPVRASEGHGAGGEWRVKLGDLGAAYFLPQRPAAPSEPRAPALSERGVGAVAASAPGGIPAPEADPAWYLRRMESRALGHMAGELLQRLAPPDDSGEASSASSSLLSRARGMLQRAVDLCGSHDLAHIPDPAGLLRHLEEEP